MLAAGLVDALVGVAEALLRRRVCRAMPAAVRGSESHNEGFITPVPERGVISTYIWKDVKSESEELAPPASCSVARSALSVCALRLFLLQFISQSPAAS
jgi:hypothetical protein